MRLLSQTNIALPPDIERWAHDAAADPCVRSVILFGSRATGAARPGSDWDVALVTRDNARPAKTLLEQCWQWSPEHGAVLVDENTMLAEKDTYASLASEVCLGVVLDGENYEGTLPMATHNKTEAAGRNFAAMAGSVWGMLCMGIMRLGDCRRSGFQDLSPDMEKHSSDAAELTAKLLCLSLGVRFVLVHDVSKLAERMPDEWRDRIAALNGNTHHLHQAHYGDLEPEDIQNAYRTCHDRMEGTLDILRELAGMDMPIEHDKRLRLRANLNSASEKHMAATTTATCETVVADLVAKFMDARGAWLSRLDRDVHAST